MRQYSFSLSLFRTHNGGHANPRFTFPVACSLKSSPLSLVHPIRCVVECKCGKILKKKTKKGVDCQKGRKKSQKSRKEKSCPKDALSLHNKYSIQTQPIHKCKSNKAARRRRRRRRRRTREREREQKRISATDMPRYYCEYCDAYLTHDSATVRRQHISGFKHKANVRNYYLQFTDFNTNPNATMTTPTTMMPPNAMAMPGMMMGGGGVGGGGGGQMMPPPSMMPPPMMMGQQQPQSMMPPPKY